MVIKVMGDEGAQISDCFLALHSFYFYHNFISLSSLSNIFNEIIVVVHMVVSLDFALISPNSTFISSFYFNIFNMVLQIIGDNFILKPWPS